jgi:hypothetical protein
MQRERSSILVPSRGLDSWRDLLADRVEQWKPGHSAMELAVRWEDSAGFPPEVAALFEQQVLTRGARMLLGIPEHRVPLAGGARASQTDLWVLSRVDSGLMSVAVEGKVDEPFGPTVGEWKPDGTPGRTKRWATICSLLELETTCAQAIRYQLFHRTVSALLEAQRFSARCAAVIVHSFSETAASFHDFQQFVRLLGGEIPRPDAFVEVPPREGIALFFGWASASANTGGRA